MNIIIVFLATKEAAAAIPPTAGQQHGRGKPVGTTGGEQQVEENLVEHFLF
jgi:hypothetical protein